MYKASAVQAQLESEQQFLLDLYSHAKHINFKKLKTKLRVLSALSDKTRLATATRFVRYQQAVVLHQRYNNRLDALGQLI